MPAAVEACASRRRGCCWPLWTSPALGSPVCCGFIGIIGFTIDALCQQFIVRLSWIRDE
jgi:hypothetical protein